MVPAQWHVFSDMLNASHMARGDINLLVLFHIEVVGDRAASPRSKCGMRC